MITKSQQIVYIMTVDKHQVTQKFEIKVIANQLAQNESRHRSTTY